MCNEGWTFYAVPGPKYKGDVDAATADSNYYNWSDKFNSLGLGENVQIATSNQGGALLALVNGKWVVLRVPYPARLLQQVDQRPHRRSGYRLEGARASGRAGATATRGTTRATSAPRSPCTCRCGRIRSRTSARGSSKFERSNFDLSNRRGSERIAPTPICFWPSRTGTIRIRQFASISLKGIFMDQLIRARWVLDARLCRRCS